MMIFGIRLARLGMQAAGDRIPRVILCRVAIAGSVLYDRPVRKSHLANRTSSASGSSANEAPESQGSTVPAESIWAFVNEVGEPPT